MILITGTTGTTGTVGSEVITALLTPEAFQNATTTGESR
jgi:hypothetical protein